MLRDLLVASALSLTLGVACLDAWYRIRYPDVLAILGFALSVAVGPYLLWLRGRQPIVPITAIYAVVMCVLIIAAYFGLAFRLGRIDL